ncbi:hypothetical protein LC613_11485 [Nostoc sphaeroides CHAB 2801]|uniref:Uncharacterized protein n=1 Tax=Nostoc sphaeroides CCNUC1 TaxID=2653204 RepID=A0A5P8VUA7_9NOSO|nr:hypothetical protein [Nostoc sphaeroides]MCC5628686.1 hypothetical protein [Nostoc sphaeroides CHAB 2801]QFS44038.1 hypothetical protein GXM_01511 [Nostoc sphaeroides CCNUC1]
MTPTLVPRYRFAIMYPFPYQLEVDFGHRYNRRQPLSFPTQHEAEGGEG